jgi:hypothetical protein
LKLCRCSLIMFITLVIELRAVQLNSLLNEGPHHIFDSSTLMIYFFCALNTPRTFSGNLIFQFWVPLFWENVLVSLGIVLLDACCLGTLCSPAAHACFINISSTNYSVWELLYISFRDLSINNKWIENCRVPIAFWKVWGAIWSSSFS